MKKPILSSIILSLLVPITTHANELINSDMQYVAAINIVKNAATQCNMMPIQESKEALSCYEAQRTILKRLIETYDSSNKALMILDYSKPFIAKSYNACESTYPAELRGFFKAQISQCKLGADVTLAVYAINSIANS